MLPPGKGEDWMSGNGINFIQDSTKAYMIAYRQAIEDTHNPSMAAQIASVVVVAYMNAFKEEIMQEQKEQAMLAVMVSMMEKAKKESVDDNEQSTTKKTDTKPE